MFESDATVYIRTKIVLTANRTQNINFRHYSELLPPRCIDSDANSYKTYINKPFACAI